MRFGTLVITSYSIHYTKLYDGLSVAGYGALDPGNIGSKQLAGSVTWQQSGQFDGVLDGGEQLMDSGEDHMGIRQGGAEPSVALIGDKADTTGFGNQEISAGETDIRIEVFV